LTLNPEEEVEKVKQYCLIIGSSKALLIAAVLLGVWFEEFNVRQFLSAYAHWPHSEVPTLSSRLATWDSAHYLILSEQGYYRGSHSCAFFPLWPALMCLASGISFGHPVIASMVLANLLSLAAFWWFWKIVQPTYGAKVSQDALILLLACPGSLFFSFSYTESLFLLLVLVFFWYLRREEYGWPVAVAFLMPLTKAIGVFMVLPLAWHLYERKKPMKYWLLLAVPLLGYASYFGIMHAFTGNAFEGFEAQKAYPYSPSIKNMFNLGGFFSVLIKVGSLDGMMDSVLDRLFFILFLALLPAVWRLNRTWFWFTLAAGMVPAMTSWFMSYRRYAVVCFPLFIVLAQIHQKPERRWLFWYYVFLLAGVQAWAVTRFVNFYWAG